MRRTNEEFAISALDDLGTATTKEIMRWILDHHKQPPSMHQMTNICYWSSKITEVGTRGRYIVWGILKDGNKKRKVPLFLRKKSSLYDETQILFSINKHSIYQPVVEHIIAETDDLFCYKDVIDILCKLYKELGHNVKFKSICRYAYSYLKYMTLESFIVRISHYPNQYKKMRGKYF